MINAPRRYTCTKNMYIDINTYFLSQYCFHHYSMNTHNCWFHCCVYMYLPMEVNRNRKVFTGTYIYIYDHCLWVYTVIYWTLLNPQKLMSRNINETTVCSCTSIFCCDLLLTYPGDSSWSRKDYHWHIYSSHWEPRNHSTKQFILIVWNLNCTIA